MKKFITLEKTVMMLMMMTGTKMLKIVVPGDKNHKKSKTQYLCHTTSINTMFQVVKVIVDILKFIVTIFLSMQNCEFKLKSHLFYLQRKYVLHLGCQLTFIRKQIMTAWLFRLLHLCQMNKILE